MAKCISHSLNSFAVWWQVLLRTSCKTNIAYLAEVQASLDRLKKGTSIMPVNNSRQTWSGQNPMRKRLQVELDKLDTPSNLLLTIYEKSLWVLQICVIHCIVRKLCIDFGHRKADFFLHIFSEIVWSLRLIRQSIRVEISSCFWFPANVFTGKNDDLPTCHTW